MRVRLPCCCVRPAARPSQPAQLLRDSRCHDQRSRGWLVFAESVAAAAPSCVAGTPGMRGISGLKRSGWAKGSCIAVQSSDDEQSPPLARLSRTVTSSIWKVAACTRLRLPNTKANPAGAHAHPKFSSALRWQASARRDRPALSARQSFAGRAARHAHTIPQL